jgi:hypothetical protein
MQKPPPVIITLKLRARYMFAGAIMLALWGASLIQLFRGTNDVPAITIFLATITVLPLGLIALLGAVTGTETGMRRAQTALLAGAGLLVLVLVMEALRRIIFAAGN